jgi:phosphohistidine phosphatase SixA
VRGGLHPRGTTAPGRARLLAGLALLVSVLAPLPAAAEDLWAALREGGLVVMIRHTITTPGVGDPAGFRLDDCATQRNLTDAGRADARQIGAAFRARGVDVGPVLSSRWCRCLETARLAFGRAEPWPALDNLHGRREREAEQTAAVKERIAGHRGPGNLVLVTHGSVVLPATGIHPAPGELVLLRPAGAGGFTVLGRLQVAG